MPVTTSFPGIYIEELPSSAHTITASPTSIAVFIGYTHPFKTLPQNFNAAVRVFNFTEYEREFGGLYHSAHLDANVAYAVQQFFLNGGSVAYVVALQAQLHSASPTTSFPQPLGDIDNVRFTGLEPVDPSLPMAVTVNHIDAARKLSDITITYGSRAETFRHVSLDPGSASAPNPDFIETRLNGLSDLVTVSLVPPAVSYGSFASQTPRTQGIDYPVGSIPPGAVTFNAPDFDDAFQTDGALDKVEIFNLMLIPGVTDSGIWSQALAFCERKRAFLIMDPPPNATADGMGALNLPKIEDQVDLVPKSTNGALYFPYVTAIDSLTGSPIRLPPSGYIAGIYARTDNNRGVWKAPAGLETTLNNVTGVVPEGRLTDARAGVLNPLGVNCLRTFSGVGTVAFGARTLVTANPAFEQWRYVPVRRTALFIEQTLYRNLGWVVFEPNDEPLWIAIRTSIEAFMLSLFRQGAFQGSTPSAGFQVKCDSSTTTQTDIDNGIVNILVAFRPLKPAEFVVIKIAQLAGQVQA